VHGLCTNNDACLPEILDEDIIVMSPVSIRIKEVKVVATTPEKLLTSYQGKFRS
jgi:hypothetical protein